MRLISISFFCFVSFACLSINRDLDWEDVTSNHESVLNIMGQIGRAHV